MFENLTSRLNQVFDQLRRRGKLSEADVDAAMREVRLALLEADVHFSGKEIPGAPHEVLLVLDATSGRNAIAQAKTFVEFTGVTGIALTKLDGTAKGGVVLSVTREIAAPIRYIGVGEKADDLRPFDANSFAEALF